MKAAGTCVPPCLVLCGLDQKYSPLIYHLFVASSSTDAPSGLNASEKTAPPADTGPPPRFYIGLSLTLGFTLMFVVDQVGSYFSSKGKMATLSWYCCKILESHLYTYRYNNFFYLTCLITDHMSNVGITATVGLVIHAAGAVSRSHVKFCQTIIAHFSSETLDACIMQLM